MNFAFDFHWYGAVACARWDAFKSLQRRAAMDTGGIMYVGADWNESLGGDSGSSETVVSTMGPRTAIEWSFSYVPVQSNPPWLLRSRRDVYGWRPLNHMIS